MRNLFESLFGVARSGLHPREVGVAVFLGTLAGFVTGWNLTLVVVLLLALLLAHPLKVFAQTWGVAAALAWTLTPFTFRFGRYLLEDSELGAALAPHAGSVWVALFDLDRFTLIGGMCVGLLLAVLAAGFAAWTTRALQNRYLRLLDRFTNHEQRICRIAIGAACWMIFGSALRPNPQRARARTLRFSGLAITALVLAPATAGIYYYAPGWVQNGVLASISAANRAEVEAAQTELSLSDGMLDIHDLHIPNANDLDRDRLVIGRVIAELKPGPLLRGRVLINRILIDGLDTNVARPAPAKPYKMHVPGFDSNDGESQSRKASQHEPGWEFDFPIEEYARDWPQIRERLSQLEELLVELEKLSRRGEHDPSPSRDALYIPETYREMRSARCDFGQPQPRLLIQALKVKNPSAKWGLGDNAELEITCLSSDGPLIGQPTKVRFAAPELGVQLATTLNYHQPGAEHGLRLAVDSVPLPKLVASDKLSDRFAITFGHLSFTAEGKFCRERLCLPLEARAANLQLQLQGSEKLGGLSPELWNEGLQKLGSLEFAGLISGRLSRPQLQVDTPALAQQLRHQLHAAGHLMLVAAIDQELNRGRTRVDSAVAAGAGQARDAMGQVAAQANEAMELTQRHVDHVEQLGQDGLLQAEQHVNQFQAQSQQLGQQSKDQVDGQISQGEQRVEAWLQKQNNRYQPLPGVPLPGANSGQTLLGQAAHGMRQTLQANQQRYDQTVAATADSTRGNLAQGQSTLSQASVQATHQVDAARAGVHQMETQARTAIEGGENRIGAVADQTAGGIRAAVDNLGPGGSANTQGEMHGAVTVDQAESKTTDAVSLVQGAAAATGAGLAPPLDPANDVVVVEYPPLPPTAGEANATTSTEPASRAGNDRYATSPGYNPDPYGTADANASLLEKPAAQETVPPSVGPKTKVAVAEAANTAPRYGDSDYRSSYDPLYQNDAAARPAGSRPLAAGRYYDVNTSPDSAAMVYDRSQPASQSIPGNMTASDSPRVSGMQPGQRYDTTFPRSRAAYPTGNTRDEAAGRTATGDNPTNDGRWSNVPVAAIAETSRTIYPPREQPESQPPTPPPTTASNFGSVGEGERSGDRATASTSLGMRQNGESIAGTPESESRFRRVVKRVWPFGSRTAESDGSDTVGPGNMADAPLVAERPSASTASSMPSTAPPDGFETERKPWYRRLW